MTAIHHIPVHSIEVACPSCGSSGASEVEIANPDPIRGGDITARMQACDMCEGRGAVDLLEHQPWEPCMYEAEQLQKRLEEVAETYTDELNDKIDAALAAFARLEKQIDTLKEWKQ